MTSLKQKIADLVLASVPHLENFITKFKDIKNVWTDVLWPLLQSTFKVAFGVELPEWSVVVTMAETWWNENVVNKLKEKFIATFGIEPPPIGASEEGAMSKWWDETVKPAIAEKFKTTFGIDPPPIGATEEGAMSQWWTNTAKPVLDAKFKATFGIDPPTWESIPEPIRTWWTNTAKPKIEGITKAFMEIKLPDFTKLKETFDTDWKALVLPTITGLLTGNSLTITPMIGLGLAGLITSNWDTHIAPLLGDLLNQVMTIQPPDFTDFKDLFNADFATSAQELFSELGGKLSEALGTGGETLSLVLTGVKDFGTWCADNKTTISEFFATMGGEAGDGMLAAGELLTIAADAIKGLAAIGTEAVTGMLQWILTHGNETAAIIETLAVGFMIAAAAAHPYAAAIVAAAAALGLMKEYGGEDRYDHFFDAYSDEDLAKLQSYVDAMNEYNAALKAQSDALDRGEDGISEDGAVRSAKARMEAALAEAEAVEGLIGTYNSWNTGQDGWKQGMYLDVPVRTAEGSEAAVQGELDAMTFESDVTMNADVSRIQSALNRSGFTAFATVLPSFSSLFGGSTVKWNADGAVFDSPTIFNTHRGLQGVGEAGPEAVAPIGVLQKYVSDAVASQNAGMVSVLQNMLSTLNQINTNTAAGHQVVLDSGVMVGKMAPKMDVQLGTIGNRKGRRN